MSKPLFLPLVSRVHFTTVPLYFLWLHRGPNILPEIMAGRPMRSFLVNFSLLDRARVTLLEGGLFVGALPFVVLVRFRLCGRGCGVVSLDAEVSSSSDDDSWMCLLRLGFCVFAKGVFSSVLVGVCLDDNDLVGCGGVLGGSVIDGLGGLVVDGGVGD